MSLRRALAEIAQPKNPPEKTKGGHPKQDAAEPVAPDEWDLRREAFPRTALGGIINAELSDLVPRAVEAALALADADERARMEKDRSWLLTRAQVIVDRLFTPAVNPTDD